MVTRAKTDVDQIRQLLASFHWPEDELVRISSEMAGLHWQADITHVLVDVERQAEWVSRCTMHFDFCASVTVEHVLSPSAPQPRHSTDISWPGLATIAAIECDTILCSSADHYESLAKVTIRTFVGPRLSIVCAGVRLEWLDIPSEEQRRRADIHLA